MEVQVQVDSPDVKKHVNSNTIPALVTAIKQCSKTGDLQGGKTHHLNALSLGLHTNKYVSNALINMYCKCNSIYAARGIFDSMLHRDIVSWNTLILGHVEHGESPVAMELLTRLDCTPSSATYVAALKACGCLAANRHLNRQFCLEIGMAIHRHARARGVDTHVFVENALVDVYRKCGSMALARYVFDHMVYRNVVSWTSLIMGYVENGESMKAMEMYARMDCEPNHITFISVLKACIPCLEKGMAIHKQAKVYGLDTDVYVASNLVEMYSKCRDMVDARNVFDSMVHRNVVSWTSMINGYVENGEGREALNLFMSMECESNTVTYVAVLKACCNTETVHACICKSGAEQDGLVSTTLVDVYGKCGRMEAAQYVFDTIHTQDTVSFSALIAGYSLNCEVYHVFKLVINMEEAGLVINGITLLSILIACKHAGMVNQGKKYFESMTKYGIIPSMEHYTCMVDMLGRANRFQEAVSIIKNMPFKCDNVMWTSLLANNGGL